jgi:5-methylthioadenosine/S-adenosylhomocysteine deaminase
MPPTAAPDDLQLLAADWVLPVTAEPIRDGVVAVDGPNIAWVGPRRDLPSRFLRAKMRAFPRSLILPGWVNAHSHLNLTAALGALPGSGERFADWIRDLLRLREQWSGELIHKATVAGMDLLASTGTTTVAHVSTLPDLEPFLEHPMRSVVFHEPIGFAETRAASLFAEARDWVEAGEAIIDDAGAAGRVHLGLAPHAPYSVSGALIRFLWEWTGDRGLPFSIHLSETRTELEFVRSGTGQLREFLEERGAWDPNWAPPGGTPVEYLASLGVLAPRRDQLRGLAVHCNYLTERDQELLAQSALAPVWCPGSHLFFEHARHPAGRLLAEGAAVALGTDSAASNQGLNMLREVRLAAEALPEVPPTEWIRAATLTAAEGLGLGDRVGSLETGKAADLQVLESAQEETDPLSALFRSKLRVRSVLVDGAEMKIR